MDIGSKFVYLGNEAEDFEEVKVSAYDDAALSLSDCSDDDGETCVLDILDTAGQEEYSSMRDAYVRVGNGFVIIYSITDPQSLHEAESIFNWLKRVKDETPYCIFVANKKDLEGSDEAKVTRQEGEDLSKRLGVPFYETSAKTGEGVEKAMHGLVRTLPRYSSDYKVIMLGAGAVGKSSITLRFVSNTFVDDYDPTIEDSFRKMITVSGLQAISKDQKKAYKKRAKKSKSSRPPSSRSRLQIDNGNVSLAQATPYRSKKRSGFLTSLFGSVKKGLGGSGRPRSGPPAQQQQMPAYQQTFDSSSDEDLDLNTNIDRANNVDIGASCVDNDRESVKKTTQRKADGNVVLIPLRKLENEPNLVTGEPITCKKCGAILTSTGKLEGDGEKKTWVCEFCGERHDNLEISEDEIPKEDDFDYMISPATKSEDGSEGAAAEVEKKTTPGTLVYCMDISSSMSARCHVPESHTAWREERTRGEESIADVTRLKCIQKAIERLAEELKLEQPEKKVLLVVFSSQVGVKAGGRQNSLPQFDNMKATFEQLLETGLQLANDYPLENIEDTHDAIDAAVKALRTTGCTALGPALSICTGFVSKIPSSEIILCTDGEPNVGVGGNRDYGFYDMIGTYARSKNITINIISMEGAATGLQYVSKAAEKSGGSTTKLNPVEIMRQLRLISQNEVVATGVTVRFYLHPYFVFDEPDFPDNLSQLEKEVGNVKKDTDITFKFKLRDSSKASEIKTVPFQVQIEYTRPDGMQVLRVLSKSSEATTSRQAMEENINVSVLGVSGLKSTAKMSEQGQSTEAQHMVKKLKRLVDRGAKDRHQREERLAFRNELAQWDEHLTENHARMKNGNFRDDDAKFVQMASRSNVMQQQAAPLKMAEVSKRKMKAASKQAYYAYQDSY